MGRERNEDGRTQFAAFLILTDEQRLEQYGTHLAKDFADQIGVTPKTLTEWKKEPAFKKMKKQMQENLWDERLSNVVEANYKRAIQGDVSAQTQYYKLLGVTKDRVETISSQDIEYVILETIKIIQEEVKDKEALAKISQRLVDLSQEL